MNIKTLFAITLICFGLSVAAEGDVVSQAYEVALSDFRAPSTDNGTAAFEACGTCQYQVVRVSASTRYEVNGKVVRLADFLKAIQHAGTSARGDVTVVHHLESDTIKSINVSL